MTYASAENTTYYELPFSAHPLSCVCRISLTSITICWPTADDDAAAACDINDDAKEATNGDERTPPVQPQKAFEIMTMILSMMTIKPMTLKPTVMIKPTTIKPPPTIKLTTMIKPSRRRSSRRRRSSQANDDQAKPMMIKPTMTIKPMITIQPMTLMLTNHDNDDIIVLICCLCMCCPAIDIGIG